MPGIRIDGRDHPILRDPCRDPKRAIRARVEVLPDDRREHRRRLRHARRQLPAVQPAKKRVSVLRERVDQRLPRLRVLVIADRLPRRPVVVIAREHPAQLCLEHPIARGEQTADR